MQQDHTSPPAGMMPGQQAQPLLEQLAEWGPMTTIVIHGGSVFEFSGPFPKGSQAEGSITCILTGMAFMGILICRKLNTFAFRPNPTEAGKVMLLCLKMQTMR